MSRTRLRSSGLFRVLGLFVCLALLMGSLVTAPPTAGKVRRVRSGNKQGANGQGQGQERRVAPPATQPGPPAVDLPSLDELRNSAHGSQNANGGRPPRA